MCVCVCDGESWDTPLIRSFSCIKSFIPFRCLPAHSISRDSQALVLAGRCEHGRDVLAQLLKRPESDCCQSQVRTRRGRGGGGVGRPDGFGVLRFTLHYLLLPHPNQFPQHPQYLRGSFPEEVHFTQFTGGASPFKYDEPNLDLWSNSLEAQLGKCFSEQRSGFRIAPACHCCTSQKLGAGGGGGGLRNCDGKCVGPLVAKDHFSSELPSCWDLNAFENLPGLDFVAIW